MLFNAIVLMCLATGLSRLATKHVDNADVPEMKLYDVFHRILPFNSNANILADVIVVTCLLAMCFVGVYDHKGLCDFFIVYAILIIIRTISMSITILPDWCTTIWKKYGKNNVFGGCRDKLFSGHTATALLFSLFIYKKTNMVGIFLLPVIVSLCTLISREHYSIDVLFAWIITIFVWQNRQLILA